MAGAALAALMLSANLFAQIVPNPQVVAKPDSVQTGLVVSFDYTLTDQSGQVIDTSKGKEPMSYIHGGGQIIPGLESQLTGMKVGGEKRVTVKPEDGYGAVNPQAFQEVAKERLPAEALKVGTILTAQNPQGQSIPARVHEIKEKTVIVDLNHPLAGKILIFAIKITGIKAAEK